MLDDRKARILQALVETYIGTGEPVSSSAVLEACGLAVSSATIRNELARLESYGFVAQPHTSAGRVPTDHGYRYYVDHCSPARLRSATLARIEDFFAGVHRELTRLLKDTSGLLSDITSYPAVVIGPGLVGESIRGVHLAHLGARVVLVVSVTASGRVSQEVVRTRSAFADADLDEAEALLNRALVGKAVSDAATALQASLAEQSAEVGDLVTAAAEALERADDESRDVYLGGTSQFTELWQDLANVHRILELLEEESAVLAMIDQASTGTSVRIGGELDVDDVDLAVVATPYEAGEHGSGRIAVLGPMRMDYRRTIRVVEEVGDGLADSLGA